MKFPVKNIQFITALLALAVVYVGCNKSPDIRSYNYPAPEPKTVFPDTGYAGFATVTITGTQFGNYKQAVKVFFGGIQADTILSCEDSKIVARVPKSAVSGKVGLQVWTNTIDSIGQFRVVDNPVVTKASKDIGFPGDTVDISGKGFGTDLSKIQVKFNGTTADINEVNDSTIRVILPVGFSSGNISVFVNAFPITGPGFRAFATVPDPIYWLSFEGNLKDNMGNTGTTFIRGAGPDSSFVPGISGRAIYFQGYPNTGVTTTNSTVSCPAQISKHKELTISCWVNWANIGARNNEPVYDIGQARGNRICLMTKFSSGYGNSMVSRLTFEKLPTVYTDKQYMWNALTPTPLDKNEWRHTTLVISTAQSVMILYVNGVEVTRQVLDGKADPTFFAHNKVYIGGPGFLVANEPTFSGTIDEFQIFNQALNADQVYAVYFKHKPNN